ncbi:MAG: hypothetical protein WA708_05440 [Acidobacteriaceae bacterium]
MPFPSNPRSSAKFSSSLLRNPAKLGIAFLVAAACPRAGAQSTAPPPAYTITDLGTLPGGYQTAIYKLPDGQYSAPTGGSYGFAINASGDVAGYSYAASGDSHAALFREGNVIDLGPGSAGGINGYDQVASGPINDSGQTVNGTKLPNDFTSYSEPPYGPGNAINASGQISGRTGLQAAVYSDGSVYTLIPPTDNFAQGINDTAQQAGSYDEYGDGEYEAFLYTRTSDISFGGIFTPIGRLPGDEFAYGIGINAAGQVVGPSFNPITGVFHAFLYTTSQGMVNVNSLLPAGSGWTLTDAEAINDKGQITGAGTNPQGYQHAYLLSPVFTQFSTLNAVVDLIGSPASTFAAGGRFTLGTTSHGINPITETTVLQLGGNHIAIPPGSFTQTNGVYVYKGKIGNVSLQAVIRPVAANTFLFGIVGQGAVGLPPSYPLNLVWTIGTDTGTEAIQTNYNAAGLTVAQACQIFGLTCS